MAQKLLKLKRVYIYAIYNSLRNTPPKDYPTTEEIKTTISDILPAFKTHISEYLELVKKAEELSVAVAAKEITEKEVAPKMDEINVKWRVYNKEHGQEIVDVQFDGSVFTTLKGQFNRNEWGTKWMANIEEFSELLEVFAAAEKEEKK